MLASYVRCQLGLLSKSLPADAAPAKVATARGVHVQALFVVKHSLARGTAVELVAVVQPQMALQVVLLREGSFARLAPVRAVGAVRPLMRTARGDAPESRGARGAHAAAVRHRVWRAVRGAVVVQRRRRPEPERAQVALVRLLQRVRAGVLVQLERRAEGLVAVLAGVRLALLVTAHVDAKVSGCAQCLGAQGALVLLSLWITPFCCLPI